MRGELRPHVIDAECGGRYTLARKDQVQVSGKMRPATFANCYEDGARAEAYATLEFKNTYHLAYRDIPAILSEHVRGRKSVDFGCGAGRSTRFLRQLGFEVTGVDIAEDMIRKARELDPSGDYRLIRCDDVPGDDLSALPAGTCDLVLAAFTFDNIAGGDIKLRILRDLARLLNREGKLVLIVSRPEIYIHEWASFSTKDFPENQAAKSGDKVRIIVTDHADPRPVEDILWTDEAYREVFEEAQLRLLRKYEPLGREDEPYRWVSEAEIAPWSVYVLEGV
jgi:SAM-dependent methyltransferase